MELYISMLLTAGWVSTRYVLDKERQIKSLLKDQPAIDFSLVSPNSINTKVLGSYCAKRRYRRVLNAVALDSWRYLL